MTIRFRQAFVPPLKAPLVCSSKCPECSETCIGGAHPGGYHGCSKGHAW